MQLKWISAIMLGILVSCSSHWTIRERSGQTQIVSDPTFIPSERIEVRVGALQRFFEARHVQSLVINPSIMKTMDSKVYYGVRLQLTDGSQWPSPDLVDSGVVAFMDVSGYLTGNRQSDLVQIPLSKLYSLSLGSAPDSMKTDSLNQDSTTKDSTTKDSSKADSVNADSTALDSNAKSPDSVAVDSNATQADSAKTP